MVELALDPPGDCSRVLGRGAVHDGSDRRGVERQLDHAHDEFRAWGSAFQPFASGGRHGSGAYTGTADSGRTCTSIGALPVMRMSPVTW